MLVLDANILVRAVLGYRVLELIDTYSQAVELVAPDAAFEEARAHVPRLLKVRKRSQGPPLTSLDQLAKSVRIIAFREYARYEPQARLRMDRRDPDDWPILACALAMNCPVWTEDTDFFGVGVATWTTDRVDLFLSGASGDR
jgi:predicted nucleic acid-binding protein